LGRLVWAAVGHDKKTRGQFFDLLDSEREVVKERYANATMCTESFHVVSWPTEALDEVRREVWNEAHGSRVRSHAADPKEAGCAL
jgi:transposase